MVPIVKEWLTLIALVAGLFTPVALLWLKSQFATKDEIARLVEKFGQQFAEKNVTIQAAAVIAKVDILEDRVSRIEGTVQHLPDKDLTHRMEISLSELRGEMKALAERLSPVAATSARLQEFLLEQSKAPRAR